MRYQKSPLCLVLFGFPNLDPLRNVHKKMYGDVVAVHCL